MTRFPLVVGVAAVALVEASSVWASIYVHASRDQPFQVSDNDPHAVPLDDAGRTKLGWHFFEAARVHMLVSYSVNCIVQGGGGYVAITILVDGKPTKPSGGGADVVLCSETPASGVPVSATRISGAYLKDRPHHDVQVIAKGVNTSFWQISNAFLSVTL
jgi:hypothetical protein